MNEQALAQTHRRVAGRDYGWPHVPGILVADLWAPHGRVVPSAWLDRFLYIPEFERRRAEQARQA
jgi:hypothetical protein